jgi:hypothetical protein
VDFLDDQSLDHSGIQDSGIGLSKDLSGNPASSAAAQLLLENEHFVK